jgi:hypothetical protein
VSPEDRKNYDHIKAYTLILKNLTEKSELWLPESAGGVVAGDDVLPAKDVLLSDTGSLQRSMSSTSSLPESGLHRRRECVVLEFKKKKTSKHFYLQNIEFNG